MLERNMMPVQKIRSDETIAAEMIGWKDKVGQLAPGYFADLIAVSDDPVANVRRLDSRPFVVGGYNL